MVLKRLHVAFVLIVAATFSCLLVYRQGEFVFVDWTTNAFSTRTRDADDGSENVTSVRPSVRGKQTSREASVFKSSLLPNTLFPEAEERVSSSDGQTSNDAGFVYIRTYGVNVSDHYTTLKVAKDSLDVMSMKPIRFDPAYKNPCWFSDEHNTLFNDTRLHCLPYFFLIGVKKSATSDLFSRLVNHPKLLPWGGHKETQWWPRLRFMSEQSAATFRTPIVRELATAHQDPTNVTFYIKMFDNVTRRIHDCRMQQHGTDYHHCITGDGTPANFHMNKYWELLPGNEGLDEPRYTNFNYIKHLIPDAKLIVIFRDPVTRSFSDFQHEMRIAGLKHQADKYLFHKHVMLLMDAYNECFRRHTRRQCVYNNTIARHLRTKGIRPADSFMASFYEVYMRDIYQTFEAHNVLTILFSDYTTHNMEHELRRVFSFLDLSQPPVEEMGLPESALIRSNNPALKRKTMLDVTRTLLYEFFQPHNAAMAKLMSDDRYLFKQPES